MHLIIFTKRLDANLLVKVSDFGLTRTFQHKTYYRATNLHTELPVRWMSPEAMEQGKFTTESDVVCIETKMLNQKAFSVLESRDDKQNKEGPFCST